MAVIGIDLGGTKLASALFSDAGSVLARETVALDGRQGADVGKLVAGQMRRLLYRAAETAERVTAAGVSVPGIYYAGTGRVWAPNIPGWDDYPLRDELQDAAGDGLAVRVDSDRACYILGESWRGVARGCRHAVFLAVGTGIGAGVLVDGRVLRGAGDIAGAIGWLALDRPYRAGYEAVGCFEYHASGAGLARVARDALRDDPAYDGVLRRKAPEAITAPDVFEAEAGGDPLARRVLDDAVAFWGMTAANLVSLFNPEKIVFGGGVFGPAARLLGRIREEALRWAQPISIRQVSLEVSALGGDAGWSFSSHRPSSIVLT
jgi:glucokinase